MDSPCCPGRKHTPDPSERDSYLEGFLTGLSWKDIWEARCPGGPWITSGCSKSAAANIAWRTGWKSGHEAKLNGHFACVANVPDLSFETVVAVPRRHELVRSYQSEIAQVTRQLEALQARLAEVIASPL